MAILDAVRGAPGSTRSELVQLTGIPWTTLAYHLENMQERGEVAMVADGRRMLFCVDIPLEWTSVERLVRLERQARDFLHAVNRSGPVSVARLERMGLRPKAIRRYIRAFVAAGLLQRAARRGQYVLVACPLRLRDAIREPRTGMFEP